MALSSISERKSKRNQEAVGSAVFTMYVQQLSQIDWLPGQGPPSIIMSSIAMSLLTDEPLIALNTIWNSNTKRERVA